MWAVWIRNCDVVHRNPWQKASVTVKKYLQEENGRAPEEMPSNISAMLKY
jgi:hypothetical protein